MSLTHDSAGEFPTPDTPEAFQSFTEEQRKGLTRQAESLQLTAHLYDGDTVNGVRIFHGQEDGATISTFNTIHNGNAAQRDEITVGLDEGVPQVIHRAYRPADTGGEGSFGEVICETTVHVIKEDMPGYYHRAQGKLDMDGRVVPRISTEKEIAALTTATAKELSDGLQELQEAVTPPEKEMTPAGPRSFWRKAAGWVLRRS